MKLKIIVAIVLTSFLQSCSFVRCMQYWWPNITDHKIFHHTEMIPGDSIFYFNQGDKRTLKNYDVKYQGRTKADSVAPFLDDYLKTTKTTAFIVIREDSILFEKYYRGYTRDSISKNFSISKSVTSLLMGIAIDEGYIESVHDPVTKYVPELKKKDPMFELLTVEHLLNMRAGFKFNENNLIPFSRATNLYYGANHLGKIKRAKFKHKPGEYFEYQSLATALLGIIVERAIQKNLSEYMQEKVWIPLGMENKATWDIDDKRHNSNKAHIGVNATAIDLAKIGRLYMNKGRWNERQIVSADWIAKSTTPTMENEKYQYQWWNLPLWVPNPNGTPDKRGYSCFPDSLSASQFAEKVILDSCSIRIRKDDEKKNLWSLVMYPDLYFAEGILSQLLFVCPSKNIIVVRLGEEDKNEDYYSLVYHLIKDI